MNTVTETVVVSSPWCHLDTDLSGSGSGCCPSFLISGTSLWAESTVFWTDWARPGETQEMHDGKLSPGRAEQEVQEIIQTYRLHISQDIPQDNLAMFYSSYDR